MFVFEVVRVLHVEGKIRNLLVPVRNSVWSVLLAK